MPGVGKMDAEPKIGRLSPTAAGRKTALTAECLTQSKARGERVGYLPERQFVEADKKYDSQKSADQPAVINTA
jgi:hypothetical protein